MRGFLFAGEVQPVGQDEAALRVGVIDHDGFAVLCVKNIAGALRIRVRKIFGCRDDAGDVHIRFDFSDRLHRIQDRGAARHVALHLEHLVRGLQ